VCPERCLQEHLVLEIVGRLAHVTFDYIYIYINKDTDFAYVVNADALLSRVSPRSLSRQRNVFKA
jgi:hypothetical protein